MLIAVAIIGYLVGHGHTGGGSSERLRTASAARVLLNYPSGWRLAAAAPAIPGLTIAHPVVLAPGGDATRAGLITGQLPAGEPSPLPRSFVAGMRRLPDTAVVDLLEVQAYRYSRLSVPGFNQTLTLYAIPNSAGNPTVVACYASAPISAFMRTCEGVVATLTLAGQSQSYDLTPEPVYAGELRASISALDGQRVALRREMRPGAPAATVRRLATSLAGAFAATGTALSRLEPSSTSRPAQAALSASILAARDAYTALASAENAEGPSSSADARRRVYEAEKSVDGALESFALLGYQQA